MYIHKMGVPNQTLTELPALPGNQATAVPPNLPLPESLQNSRFNPNDTGSECISCWQSPQRSKKRAGKNIN